MREELTELLGMYEDGTEEKKIRNLLELELENKGFEFNKKDETYTHPESLECCAWSDNKPLYFKAKDKKILKKLRKAIDHTEDVNYLPSRLGFSLTAATGASALGVVLLHNYAPDFYHMLFGATPETSQMFTKLAMGSVISLLGTILPAVYHKQLQEHFLKPKLFSKFQETETKYIKGYPDIIREMLSELEE